MLRNIIAIVSGGSSGLGSATASYLIRHGAKVVVADLPSTKDSYLRLAANACADRSLMEGTNGNGGSNSEKDPVIAFSETDVRREEDISRALDLAESLFGEPGKSQERQLLIKVRLERKIALGQQLLIMFSR